MTGKRFFLDTNAIIALLKGNEKVTWLLKNAEFVGVSIISVIELFAFSKISENDKELFESFLKRVEINDLVYETVFITEVNFFKKEYRLKLPDAVIICQALQNSASLISNDPDFNNVKNLSILHF